MRNFLHDAAGLVLFLAFVAAAYTGVSYMVTGTLVTPAQLGMALR